MELKKLEEEESLLLHRKSLQGFYQQIQETDKLNREQEVENLILGYIAKHKEFTQKEVDIVLGVLDYLRSIE
jgi:hypothetical protein